MTPGSPHLSVVDKAGRHFLPSQESGGDLGSTLAPRAKAQWVATFFLMQDSEETMIEIANGPWITKLLVGHPNSPYHARPRYPVN